MGRSEPHLWEAVLTHLRETYPGMCRRWFDDIEPLDVSGGTLRLLVREPVQLQYLRQRCQKEFTEAVQAAMQLLVAVRFVGEGEVAPSGTRSAAAPAPLPATAYVNGCASAAPSCDGEDTLLIPDHSFANFVVGPGNELAYAGALAVARKPAWAYNPYFVHSGVGLGKTHLLQAICQLAIREHPGFRIHYTSCNSFMNDFHEAVEAGRMSGFRHRFRNVDMLLIDDIHDLSQRAQSQEEFFHTFNTLSQAGKQIVLSSDAAPNQIPDLEERLSSRFNCGLVAEMLAPEFETRIAIVKSKARLRKIAMPEDVASLIAARLDRNIREIEGAITKMQGLSAITGSPFNIDLARQALGADAPGHAPPRPTIQHIVDAVTSYYGVRVGDLLSKRRHKSIALPRQVCMWLARRHTRHSLSEIGGYFGGRDHTTVMYAVYAVDEKRTTDPGIQQDVCALERALVEPHEA